jgi:hypothetical protein
MGQAQNRRIEISMIIKDETVLDIVEQYLALEVPSYSAAAATPAPTPAPTPVPTPTPNPRGSGIFTVFDRQ